MYCCFIDTVYSCAGLGRDQGLEKGRDHQDHVIEAVQSKEGRIALVLGNDIEVVHGTETGEGAIQEIEIENEEVGQEIVEAGVAEAIPEIVNLEIDPRRDDVLVLDQKPERNEGADHEKGPEIGNVDPDHKLYMNHCTFLHVFTFNFLHYLCNTLHFCLLFIPYWTYSVN